MPVTSSPVQDRPRDTGANPVKGHRDDEQPRVFFIGGEAQRAEIPAWKAQEGPYQRFSLSDERV